MTLAQMQIALDERALSMQVHAGFGLRWIVWLYPPDNPSLLCSAESVSVESAFVEALSKWDGRTAAHAPS